jgi:hypothetical protein
LAGKKNLTRKETRETEKQSFDWLDKQKGVKEMIQFET